MGINRNKVLAAARKQVRKGNWEKAIGKYQELVDDDPSDARSLLKVADLYSKIDRREEALDAYQAVASHYAGDDIYEKAVAVYKQALRLAPDEPALHRDLGDCYHRLGRLKDAVRSYHKAQKIFKKAGNPAAQRDLLERMIRLDPEDVGMRIQLAERYAKDDMQDEALELFEFAADKLDEEGRIDEFVQVAERIIFLRGEAVSLRRRVIDIYLSRGDNKHALKHLQVCFKKCPQDTQILELLVEAFRRLERYDKAVLVMHELVNLYRQEGRTDEIASTYEEILNLAPDDARAKKELHKIRRLDDSGAMTGQRRDTGPVDQQSPNSRNNTPAEPQEVDALDGIEFLDEDSEEEVEVVEVVEPVNAQSSANQPVANQAPPPEARQQQPRQQQQRHQQPSSPAGGGSGGRQQSPEPTGDDGLADISGQIEVIEAVEPTEEHGPDTSDEVVAELLKETDVFIKYGLHDKAYETIVGVIAKHPDSLQAREQMKKLQEARGNPEGAVEELLEMVRITRTTPGRAKKFLNEALELAPDIERVHKAAANYGLSLDSTGEEDELAEVSVVEVGEIEEVEPDELEDIDAGDEADELLELDMGDLEFVDEEPDEVSPADMEEHFHKVEESVVEMSELELDDADLEILEEDTDAELGGEDDDLDFDESDFDDAEDIVDMDVDIDGLGELSGDQMVNLEDDDDDEPSGGLDLYLTEDEADEMFDDLFGDFDNTGEKVNLGGDDPLGELAEVDFFIQQGLVDEAQEVLDRVRAEEPDHPGIKKRARQIDQARQGLQPEDNPFGARSLSKKFHPGAEDEDSQPNADVLDLGDAAAHNTSIELGTAYRDMGLYNEAIEEFKHALDDPDAAAAATYHIALCEIEKGATDAATSRLQTLLDQDALTDHLRQAAREKLEEIGA